MAQLWQLLLTAPLLNSLIYLYKLTNNLGVAIIGLTIGLRLLMTPLILPSLKLNKKIQELNPELNKLKEKFKNDKQGLVTAQAELYRKNGVNPASGCLPQVIQLLVLLALFNVFNLILHTKSEDFVQKLNPNLYEFNKLSSDFKLSSNFLHLNLTKPDLINIPGLPFALPGVFLILSALTQLLSSKMMAPVVAKEKKVADTTSQNSDDAMVEVQQQMLYMFPAMTLIIGYQFPSGLVIYWFIFSLAQIIQQYTTSGWGGASDWLKRLNLIKSL